MNTPLPPPPDPDARLRALLAALASADEEAQERSARSGPERGGEDPPALFEALASTGAGADSGCAAVTDADLGALAEAARDVVDADPDVRLAADVRAAALAAFSATTQVQPSRGGESEPEPEREPECEPVPVSVAISEDRAPLRRRAPVTPSGTTSAPMTPHVLRAAAVVAAAFLAWMFLAGPREASASLRLEGLDRLRPGSGRAEMGSSRRVAMGESLRAADDEILALRLRGHATVVVARGAGVDVAPGPEGEPRLRLLVGNVATLRSGVEGLEVLLADRGALRLERGEAHVTLGADGMRLALARGAVGSFQAAGVPERRLGGGVTHRRAEDGSWSEDGPAEGAAFADLFAFTGVRPTPMRGRTSSARLWRVVEGRGRRVGTTLELRPLDGSPAAAARVAWRPPGALRDAATVRLSIRGSLGITVAVEGLVHATPIPATGDLELTLPQDWAARLGGAELILRFLWPASGDAGALDFRGAVFGRPPEPLLAGGQGARNDSPGH